MKPIRTDGIASARTFLFVPGDRPERFAKAVATGADIVVLDLEDVVAPQNKIVAREHVGQWLAAGNPSMVRINASATRWHDDDIALVGCHHSAVTLAKAERPEQIGRLLEAGAGPVVSLLETALAVQEIASLSRVPGVARLAFGSIDFANQLGVDPNDHDVLRPYRSMLVLASAAAGLASPIDGVTTTFNTARSLIDDLAWAQRLGMTAKLCIHPTQIDVVHAAYTPTDSDLRWARRMIDSVTIDGTAAAVAGEMTDKAVIERARRILASALRH